MSSCGIARHSRALACCAVSRRGARVWLPAETCSTTATTQAFLWPGTLRPVCQCLKCSLAKNPSRTSPLCPRKTRSVFFYPLSYSYAVAVCCVNQIFVATRGTTVIMKYQISKLKRHFEERFTALPPLDDSIDPFEARLALYRLICDIPGMRSLLALDGVCVFA